MTGTDEALLRLIREFERGLDGSPVIRHVKKQQRENLFTGTPATVEHYLGLLRMLSRPSFTRKMGSSVRMLDVGAYLNLFSVFIESLKTRSGARFECAGIEEKAFFCSISRAAFPKSNIVEGDFFTSEELSGRRFDVVIFCHFFFPDEPPPSAAVIRAFERADSLIDAGGWIACRMPPNRDAAKPWVFSIPTSERRDMYPRDFLPDYYDYPDRAYVGDWWFARKRARPRRSAPRLTSAGYAAYAEWLRNR